MSDDSGWYYAKRADNFPQYSDEKLNGYSGPFASEREAWVHYMETDEADLNAAHTMLADARAALAERDARINELESTLRMNRQDAIDEIARKGQLAARILTRIIERTDDAL